MPTLPDILGFSNKWYPAGMASAQQYTLPDGILIRLFRPEYFIATKLEAFAQRGKGEYRWSQDFDDIVYVLDSRSEIVTEIKNAEGEVRQYIQQQLQSFLQDKNIEEGIAAVLPYHTTFARIGFIKAQMMAIVEV